MEANIIFYDFDDDGKQIIVKEKGAISKLLNVKDRLDLLGLNNKVYFYKDFKKSKNFILFFIIWHVLKKGYNICKVKFKTYADEF